ncbi:MAG TPA: alpha/beta fold hydrolase [Vicinamibacterales bacterium]|nr:alpha/beta fold hydrolase [Vicinamibacterales bacterium]
MRFERLTVEGRVVRYAAAGDVRAQQTLLLIHGFPLGVRMWEPQLARLAPLLDASGVSRWRLLAPSLPGYDGSDGMPQPSMHDYAAHVLGFLDQLDVSRAVVAGLSMGGYIAFALLRQAVQRVTGVILADTRSGVDTEQVRAGRHRMIEIVTNGGSKAAADDLIPKLFGPTTKAARPQVMAEVRQMIEAQSPVAIVDSTRAMLTREDAGPLLPTLNLPALVIVGEEDTMTPPEEAERMASALPRATLVRLPRAGHMSNMEAPEAFNDAVRRFLPGTA